MPAHPVILQLVDVTLDDLRAEAARRKSPLDERMANFLHRLFSQRLGRSTGNRTDTGTVGAVLGDLLALLHQDGGCKAVSPTRWPNPAPTMGKKARPETSWAVGQNAMSRYGLTSEIVNDLWSSACATSGDTRAVLPVGLISVFFPVSHWIAIAILIRLGPARLNELASRYMNGLASRPVSVGQREGEPLSPARRKTLRAAYYSIFDLVTELAIEDQAS